MKRRARPDHHRHVGIDPEQSKDNIVECCTENRGPPFDVTVRAPGVSKRRDEDRHTDNASRAQDSHSPPFVSLSPFPLHVRQVSCRLNLPLLRDGRLGDVERDEEAALEEQRPAILAAPVAVRALQALVELEPYVPSVSIPRNAPQPLAPR